MNLCRTGDGGYERRCISYIMQCDNHVLKQKSMQSYNLSINNSKHNHALNFYTMRLLLSFMSIARCGIV